MAEHENSVGASDDWYTPPELLDAVGMEYDLDPCAPEDWRRAKQRGTYHVEAAHHYTRADDGLSKPWAGRVFMNPPFGGRNGHLNWLARFIDHADGIAIVRAYTSSGWWHDWIPKVDAILYPRGKTKFIRPDGSVGKSPGHGVAVLAMGGVSCSALRTAARNGFGIYHGVRPNRDTKRNLAGAGGLQNIPGGFTFDPFPEKHGPCELCDGHGWTPPGCESCGTITDPDYLAKELKKRSTDAQGRPCDYCGGRGYLSTIWDCDRCGACDGTGYRTTPPTIHEGGTDGR